MPTNVAAGPETKEFLLKVIDVLLDFIKSTNDRNEKVLEFHHPEEMKKLLQLEIPDSPVSLQQLIVDCSQTLKYQVKTGEFEHICKHRKPGQRLPSDPTVINLEVATHRLIQLKVTHNKL